jgi:MoaA/NifB/PqqE/SkfB family radical SAM enzyme
MSATSGQTTYELDLPQIVRIDPVHTCNLRCIMCHVSYMKLTKGQIPFETLRRLEPLANRNVWADVGCIFEPTAHSRFGDIMQLFNDFGFRLSMTTNGTLMTDRVLQQIAGINLRQVTISFDGISKQSYEHVRRRADYDSAIGRIKNFRVAFPNVPFRVNYAVLQSTMPEMADAVDFWEEIGINELVFNPVMVPNKRALPVLKNERVDGTRDQFHEQLDKAARRIIGKRLRITLKGFELRNIPTTGEHPQALVAGSLRSQHPDARPMFDAMAYFEYGRYPGLPVDCRSPMTAAYIDFAADVWICQRFKIGNLGRRDFPAIWDGDVAHRYRHSLFADRNICENCQYFWQCINARERDLFGNPELIETSKSLSDPNKQLKLVCRIDEDATLNPDAGSLGVFHWGSSYYATPWHKKQTLSATDFHSSPEVLRADSIDALLDRVRASVH